MPAEWSGLPVHSVQRCDAFHGDGDGACMSSMRHDVSAVCGTAACGPHPTRRCWPPAADEGHGFARPPNRLDFYSRAEHFLATYLGGRWVWQPTRAAARTAAAAGPPPGRRVPSLLQRQTCMHRRPVTPASAAACLDAPALVQGRARHPAQRLLRGGDAPPEVAGPGSGRRLWGPGPGRQAGRHRGGRRGGGCCCHCRCAAWAQPQAMRADASRRLWLEVVCARTARDPGPAGLGLLTCATAMCHATASCLATTWLQPEKCAPAPRAPAASAQHAPTRTSLLPALPDPQAAQTAGHAGSVGGCCVQP